MDMCGISNERDLININTSALFDPIQSSLHRLVDMVNNNAHAGSVIFNLIIWITKYLLVENDE